MNDHFSALTYNQFHGTKKAKNAVKIWHDGKIYDSALAFGKCMRANNPHSYTQACLKKGHTPDDFKPVIRYQNEEHLAKKFEEVRQKMLSDLCKERAEINKKIIIVVELEIERA